MKWEVGQYTRHACHVSHYGAEVVALLSPRSGDFILDLGCGDGELADKISQLGCSVFAIDSSPDMIRSARSKGLDAHVVDAQTMTFDNRFDAVFSNAALHWMKDSDAVLSNVHRALKPRGRFCAEFGAKNNIRTIVSAIYEQLQAFNLKGGDYNPWYFPSGEEYRVKLETHGFEIIDFRVFERPTVLPTHMMGWLEVFATPFMRDIDADKRPAFLTSVADSVASQLNKEDGTWIADYVRCRFLAKKI